MAAPFITVTGATEQELPKHTCPFGCMITAVDGLFPGATADPRNKSLGYVAFVRTEKGALVILRVNKRTLTGTENM